MATASPTESVRARRRVGGASAASSLAGELHQRLAARRDEIEQAVLTRVYGVSDPALTQDHTYVEGLKAAVVAAVDYGLDGIAGGHRTPPPLPPVLLVQARIAARVGIGLDTVLRRYFAGYALLGDFLVEEAETMALQGASFKVLLRAQAMTFDRLIAAVSEEHAKEAESRIATTEEKRVALVQRLLDGERLDAGELGYGFEGHHVGIVANGVGAEEGIRELAHQLDRRLLLVHHEEGTVWAWFGGMRPLDVDELKRLALPVEATIAFGESGEGLEGWRFSHRQAKAALPVVMRGSGSCVRYADVALLASIEQDELLVQSLRQMYLDPLRSERDGGKVARDTLRAYFASGQNVSAAAAKLGVNRRTVTNRLRTIEEALGRPLEDSVMEMAVALQLRR